MAMRCKAGVLGVKLYSRCSCFIHINSIAFHINKCMTFISEICVLLCNYLWNSFEDLVDLAFRPFQNCFRNVNITAHNNSKVAYVMINSMSLLVRQGC